MRIQIITQNSSKFTHRLLKNKTLLKGLEKISEHGTSFSAGTSLFMSLTVRPLTIFSTPDVEKENKQYAASNSICSGLMKFAMVEAIALPIEKAVKNIDANPEKFLKNATIKNLQANTGKLVESGSYKLITQLFKLGAGFLTAIPKSMLTIALIPLLMDKLFPNKKEEKQPEKQNLSNQNKDVNFTGSFSEKISKGLGKIIDNESLQKFAKRFEHKEKDIAKHITASTDILLTATSTYQINNSTKIKENRKRALIYNNIISTAITLGLGYGIDNIVKNSSKKFIETFKQINAADPKLHKYIEGINILRPAVIFAGIYYGILPMFSTYMAEKIDKFVEKQSNKQA